MKPASAARVRPSKLTRAPHLLVWPGGERRSLVEIRANVLRRLCADPGVHGDCRVLIGSVESTRVGGPVFLIIDSVRFTTWPAPGQQVSDRLTAWRARLRDPVALVGLCIRDPLGPAEDLRVWLANVRPAFTDDSLLFRVGPNYFTRTLIVARDNPPRPAGLEFQLDWRQLERSGYQPFVPQFRAGVSDTAVALPARAAAGSRQSARFQVPQWIWATLMVLAASAISIFVWDHRAALMTPSAGSPPVLQPVPARTLQAVSKDQGVEISWDPRSALVSNARSGSIEIRDGGAKTDIPLSELDLRAGKIFYFPKSDALEVVLTTIAPSGSGKEVLRVIGAVPNRTVPDRTAQVERTRARNALPPGMEAPAAVPQTILTAAREAPDRGASEPVKPVAAAQPQPTPPPAAGPQPARDSRAVLQQASLQQPVLPPPGVTQSNPASQPPSTGLKPPANRDPNPVKPGVSAPAPDQALPPSPLGSVSSAPNLQAPVAERQFLPQVPAQLQRLIYSPVMVEVSVRIDAEGNVLDAVAPQRQGLAGVLTEISKQAAKRWKFQPARLNGKPVQSEHTLRFRFGR